MKNGRVVILHQEVAADANADERDVLNQVAFVERGLTELGYESVAVPFSFAIDALAEQLKSLQPVFCFNLVETVRGDGRLIHWAPFLLEHLGIPYCGCDKEAIFITSNKRLSKRLLAAAGLPTPAWVALDRMHPVFTPGTYIVKSVWEHASNWFDAQAIVELRDVESAYQLLQQRQQKSGGEFFAERFIDGREFNISILAGDVLAIPEIRFVDFPVGQPKVVDFRAKWQEDSFEYTHTVRSFDFAASDQPLLDTLKTLTHTCWQAFALRGYARVDFRVSEQGAPFILEINANPCISPDSGFVAAAQASGLQTRDIVERIIQDRT